MDKSSEYATPEEVVVAIQALAEEEHAKLMVVAKFWYRSHEARLQRIMGPEDLLNEAFESTLSGDRHWRKTKVSFLKHIDQTMRSIAWAHAQRTKTERSGKREFKKDPTIHERRPTTSSAEAEALAREELEKVQQFFADDSVGLAVLRCRAEGKEGEEIRSELSLSDTEYATVSRRLVRKLAKYALNH